MGYLVRWVALLIIPLLLGPEPSEDWLLTAATPDTILPNLGMTFFTGTEEEAKQLQQEFGGSLFKRESLPVHLDESVEAIGADFVQARTGNQRSGPTVLVIDTGIDVLHPDFQDGNLAAAVGSSQILDLLDESGHGTHLASIVAGTGAGILGEGKYAGVYANGRVASFQASSDEDPKSVDSFRVIEGIEWAIANRDEYDIRAITNAWGLPGEFEPNSPIDVATRAAYQAGIVVTFSAGNDGATPNQLNKYCKAPWVLCVAAATNEGRYQAYSSTGAPNPPYNHPDISAPGSFITAAKPLLEPSLPLAGVNEALYTQRTGSSMAVPHVAAAAALLAAGNPLLSPDQIMDALVETSRPMSTNLSVSGAGFLDVAAAYEATKSVAGERNDFLAGAQKYAGSTNLDSTENVEGIGSRVDDKPFPVALVAGLGVVILVALVGVVILLRLRRPA